MRKLASAFLAVAAAVALAGAAQGKELPLRAVCGTAGCQQVAGGSQLIRWDGSTSFTSPSPYYVVRIDSRDGYWLPDSGWFALKDELEGCWYNDCWLRLAPDAAGLLERASAGLEPFQPSLERVTVAGRSVADPDAFLVLLRKLDWVSLPWTKLRLIRIVVAPSQPNPWITGPMVLGYDVKHQILIRSDGHFRLPREVWAGFTSRSALRRADRAGLYAGLGVAGLAALAVLFAARRRRV